MKKNSSQCKSKFSPIKKSFVMNTPKRPPKKGKTNTQDLKIKNNFTEIKEIENNTTINTINSPTSRKVIKNTDNFLDIYNFNTSENLRPAFMKPVPIERHKRNISTQVNSPNKMASELLFNLDDDQKTLINKNTRLMSLLVQASNKIKELNIKIDVIQEEARFEKSHILNDLDRIIVNYKTYAEGYKNYQKLDEQYKALKHDYDHNYKVLIHYGESLK
jgi:hypothetical protein